MADIVLPQAGDEITSTWGQSVAKGLNGVQAGVVNVSVPAAANGGTDVTFPRPYVSAPVVVLTGATTAAYAMVINITATGFRAVLQNKEAGTVNVTASPVQWVAIGTPA